MTENLRTVLLGLYVAGLVFFTEGLLEVFGGVWESSGQRHVAIGALYLIIAVWQFSTKGVKAGQEDKTTSES